MLAIFSHTRLGQVSIDELTRFTASYVQHQAALFCPRCTQVALKRPAADTKSKMEVEPIFTSMDLPTDVFEDLHCRIYILPGMGSPGLQGWSAGVSKASRYEILGVWTVPVARQGTLEGWVRSI